MLRILPCLFVLALCASATKPPAKAPAGPKAEDAPLMLGKFSVSLVVKDLAASQAFYEKLGFHQTGGEPAKRWIVLRNDACTIGLFQGMLEKNSLTFNPGWDQDKKNLPNFTDVRDIQKTLKKRGVPITTPTDDAGSGPAYIMLTDPDGNPILIDQYVPRPKK